jgi:methionyl-tRNA formyltransferase
MRIVFMGTPDFAVESLKRLTENKMNVVGVVTVPDKPAGRGQKILESPVKKFAKKNGITILQPEKLKSGEFLEELRELRPDLQIVVAFRMLPKEVWSLPKNGTFNLHASLLPQYRGAAPINRAIMNGETRTGVSTFFLDNEIDTGKIIASEGVDIEKDETAGELHDRLMVIGADLTLKTAVSIMNNNHSTIDQKSFIIDETKLKKAPKLFRENCKIEWNKDVEDVYNHIRGLDPYPAAWSEFKSKDNQLFPFKLFKPEKISGKHRIEPGTISTDGKKYLYVAVDGGFISFIDMLPAGKKRMNVKEFLRGFIIDETWKCT